MNKLTMQFAVIALVVVIAVTIAQAIGLEKEPTIFTAIVFMIISIKKLIRKNKETDLKA